MGHIPDGIAGKGIADHALHRLPRVWENYVSAARAALLAAETVKQQ
jgi:hypothetical protein